MRWMPKRCKRLLVAILDSLYPDQEAEGTCRQSNYTATTIKTKTWFWVEEESGD